MKEKIKSLPYNIFLIFLVIVIFVLFLFTASRLKETTKKQYQESFEQIGIQKEEIFTSFIENEKSLLENIEKKLKQEKNFSSFQSLLRTVYQDNDFVKIEGFWEEKTFRIDKDGITWNLTISPVDNIKITPDGIFVQKIEDYYFYIDLKKYFPLKETKENTYLINQEENEVISLSNQTTIDTSFLINIPLKTVVEKEKEYYYITPILNTNYYLLSTFSKDNVVHYENTITILFTVFSILLIGCLITSLFYFYYRDKKWYERVYIDSVTKGYSYEKFREKYNQLNTKKALIVLDINNFNLLNKLHGYDFCNEMLKKTYEIIVSLIKEKGFCTRKLDDRFILCISYQELTEVLTVIEQINHAMKENFNLDFGITLSYGVYECKEEELKDAEMKALVAWKNAKKSSNSSYAFYEEEKITTMLETKMLLDKLEKALKNNELDIYFQAKYDVKSKNIIGSEALLRWKDETGKFISPQRFIPSAEETGLITKIDSYVLNKVCLILSALKKEGYHPGTISINVSRNKLGEENMVEEYTNVFKKYNLSKKEVELEITEGTVLSEDKMVHSGIQKLIEENFSILIDDFGTGYSSISMLKTLQMKGIKIDRSFVIDETKQGKEILKYVVTLAKGLHLETIAEGVEEKSQYEYLKKLGCDGIQGYYFSKPMPLEEYKKLLKKQ